MTRFVGKGREVTHRSEHACVHVLIYREFDQFTDAEWPISRPYSSVLREDPSLLAVWTMSALIGVTASLLISCGGLRIHTATGAVAALFSARCSLGYVDETVAAAASTALIAIVAYRIFLVAFVFIHEVRIAAFEADATYAEVTLRTLHAPYITLFTTHRPCAVGPYPRD